MGKIALKFNLFCKLILFVAFFTISACSSIKIVTIKNNTNETLQFRGQFINKFNEIDNLDFILNAGDVNSWRYEIGYRETDEIDKGLKKIILATDKGCTVVLERDAIENVAKNQGMWEISIDNNIMDCDL